MLDLREGAFVYGGGKKSPEHSEGERSGKEKSSKGGERYEMSIENTSRPELPGKSDPERSSKGSRGR